MITKLYYCRSCGDVSVEHLHPDDINNDLFCNFGCENLRMEGNITICGGVRQEFDIKRLIGDIFK